MTLEKVKTTTKSRFNNYDIAATYAVWASYEEIDEMQTEALKPNSIGLADRILNFLCKELHLEVDEETFSFGKNTRTSFGNTFHVYHLIKK